MDRKIPREMTGAELKSMLKSSINFKSLGGVKCEELNLPLKDKKWWMDSKIGMFVHWGFWGTENGHGSMSRFRKRNMKRWQTNLFPGTFIRRNGLSLQKISGQGIW